MLIIEQNPKNLPPWWDEHFTCHPLLNRLFLEHLNKTNKIPQKYFWQKNDNDSFVAGCMCRGQLPFRLWGINILRDVSLCSIPMPLGFDPGFSPETGLEVIVQAMDQAWPGFQMILGLKKSGISVPGWSVKRHFLSVDIPINFKNFDDYLGRFRHVYRRPIITSLKKWQGVKTTIVSKEQFTKKDYSLYIQLLKKLDFEYDALSYEFFRNMPLDHFFIKAHKDGEILGWIAIAKVENMYYPLFVGIEQKRNSEYDTYINIFIETIKSAIEKGIDVVRMGQTAELTKMRLGGFPSERYILVRHTNPFINWIIKNTDIFNYRKHYPPLHLFKTSEK